MRVCAHSRFISQVDPLYAFAFIRTFLDILIEYFGEVTAPTLRDNFDVVHQLLEETLDAGGHPLTTVALISSLGFVMALALALGRLWVAARWLSQGIEIADRLGDDGLPAADQSVRPLTRPAVGLTRTRDTDPHTNG